MANQQGLSPTKAQRIAAETRRYQMLELAKAGATERQIADTLGVARSLVHREIKRVLGDLAQAASHTADSVRALQMERYTTLLSRWWPQALNGDLEATKMVMSVMHRISEINGVIPKEPLISIDQRSIHLTDGEVTFSIEAASSDNTNGDSQHLLSETRTLRKTGSGDIQP